MKKVLLIKSDTMGDAPRELGVKLIGAFFRKLCLNKDKPHWVIFYGTGVKLMTSESPIMDALEILSSSGVDLLACGTCVRYFDLEDKIAVGRVSSMDEVVSIIMKGDDVVSIC